LLPPGATAVASNRRARRFPASPGRPLVLRVKDEDNAADLGRSAQAAPRGGSQKLAAQALPLRANVGGNPREPEARNVVLGEAAPQHRRRARIGEGARRQTVEAQDGLVGVVDRQEGFRRAEIVALAGVAP
jgi:hypothetical protein